MKTLENIDNIYEDLDFLHFLVEYNINEAKGIPNGLREDVEYLENLILKSTLSLDKLTKIDVDCSKLKMTKFDSLTLYAKYVNYGEGGDVTTKNIVNKNVTMTIYVERFREDRIQASLAHELLHAYVYLLDEKSEKSRYNQRAKQLSYDELFKISDNDVTNIVKQLIYATNNDELNAFIAELTIAIENKHPNNPKEAYKILYDDSVYSLYKNVKNLFRYATNVDKKKFCDDYRKLLNKTTSDRQIIKMLEQRFRYIDSRIHNVIPRICYESSILRLIDSKEMILCLSKNIWQH